MGEEVNNSYQSCDKNKKEMYKAFGVGRWRPMPVFLHVEATGKGRAVADGKRGEHNRVVSEEET